MTIIPQSLHSSGGGGGNTVDLEIFTVKIFSSFALVTKNYSQENFGQQIFVAFKRPTKIRCAENLIDQEMDNMKFSRSTAVLLTQIQQS